MNQWPNSYYEDFKLIRIIVNQNPTITINNPSICEGESVVLTANGANSYIWNTNATTPTIIVNLSSTANFTVSGTSNNCTLTQTTQVKVSPCTDIQEIEASSIFAVQPNPNTGEFTIYSEVQLDLIIIDPLGRMIERLTVKPGKNNFSIPNLTTGVYFVVGEKEGKKLLKKC